MLNSLIYPIFIVDGENVCEEISSVPGQYRWSIDRLDEILNSVENSGVTSILLFGIPNYKDEIGSSAWDENSTNVLQDMLEK